jgi:hypothetical protein
MIFGPNLVEEAETIVSHIQDDLRAMKSCQESYANKKHRPLEFVVGDLVYLKVSPMMGMKRFGVKEKMAPHYIGPFFILENVETWHTSWNCRRRWQAFMISSTYRS